MHSLSNYLLGTILLIFYCQSLSHQNLFTMLKFDVICLLANLYSHRTLKNIQWEVWSNLWGFRMPRIFKHKSIGPLFVWLDWMPLSECDHHWMSLSACEHLWASNECKLNPIEYYWTWSNALECMWMLLSEHWMQLNAFQWVWRQLNALYYWFLHEIECARMPLSECECDWTCLSTRDRLWESI
jgi:hypothetical protein